jgi:polysaccharide export outer membrane protein
MNPGVRFVWMALTIFLPLAGCSSGSDLSPLPSKPDTSSYRLGPDDKLYIKVLGANELGGTYQVQDDGTIRMLMIGKVPAAGLTSEALASNITEMLKSGRYITRPFVSVSVVTYRPFYILGEVARPGAYPYASDMRVLSAVAAAQGYTYRANQNYVIITRKGKEGRADALSSIQPDDIIRVPERYF